MIKEKHKGGKPLHQYSKYKGYAPNMDTDSDEREDMGKHHVLVTPTQTSLLSCSIDKSDRDKECNSKLSSDTSPVEMPILPDLLRNSTSQNQNILPRFTYEKTTSDYDDRNVEIDSISDISCSSLSDSMNDDFSAASTEGGQYVHQKNSFITNEELGLCEMTSDLESIDDDSSLESNDVSRSKFSSKKDNNSCNHQEMTLNSSFVYHHEGDVTLNAVEKFALNILNCRWSEVFDTIKQDPSYAKEKVHVNDCDQYPLHVLIQKHEVPCHIIKAMIKAWPSVVLEKMMDGEYPLHFCVSRQPANSNLIEIVVEVCPDSLKMTDEDGLFPIQRACLMKCDKKVICTLYNSKPELVHQLYKFGNLNGTMRFQIYNASGQQYFKEGKLKLAKDVLMEGITDSSIMILDIDKREVAKCMMLLSAIHRAFKLYDKAYKWVCKGLSIQRKIDKHELFTGHAYFEAALVLSKLKKYSKAVKYFSYAGLIYNRNHIPNENWLIVCLKEEIRKTIKCNINSSRSSCLSEI